MTIAPYIREIGRGKSGDRSLTAEQAEDLMTQVLAGRVNDLQLGAFCLAMRLKGETAAELAGFMAATERHCLAPGAAGPARVAMAAPISPPVAPDVGPAQAAPRQAVWLPSYNGARLWPNLTPLLALWLAREGVPVLVHGPLLEPGRVGSGEIFSALGIEAAGGLADVEAAWQRAQPAFMPLATLCPPLARLLDVRRVVGLRNSGHTLAKLLRPAAGAGAEVFRVVNYTHPDYAQVLAQLLESSAADAMLMRGAEGEPVADLRRSARWEIFLRGQRQPLPVPLPTPAMATASAGVVTAAPAGSSQPAAEPAKAMTQPPCAIDAEATAAYTRAVLAGELPLPAAIGHQVACILSALASSSAPPSHAAERSHTLPA